MIPALTAAAALLLGVSGAAKIAHPRAAAGMLLRLLRRPARERARALLGVRVAGLGELAVAAAVLVTGARAAVALLAVAYLVFAAVVVAALRTGAARTSCGCFGETESPMGAPHVALNAVAAAAAGLAVLRPPGAACGLLHHGVTVSALAVAQVVLIAALGYLAVTSLPALLAARRPLTTPPEPS